MLIGLFVVFMIAFIPASIEMIGRLLKEEHVIKELVITDALPPISEYGGGSAGRDNNSGSSRGMMLPYNHDGFLGVNGYKILRDDGSSRNKHRIHVKTADIKIESESDFGVVASDPGMGYGTSNEYSSGYGDGLGDDFGLPGDQPSLIDVANSIFSSPSWPSDGIMNRKPDEPAFIKFVRAPQVSRKLGRSQGKGYALVEFIIGTDGWITDRVVLAQYPEGYGIADSLFAALDDANIWPAKIAGDKISVRYHFKWILCIGNDCEGTGLSYTSGPQIIVSGNTKKQPDKPKDKSGYLR
jgi:hypothetical protein